ncbi:hypothetical protein [Isobaculum melis]|uniref:MucBP domain-containing protein n=1 Tax=Isobaculum melis TaxID=142588 RepID=A0A1H9Q065_9LACT|nr:hypothetical protein [Isobaculum melis]SER53867.1 hypothetical protein SAMN04488559_101269 [Isobaculum melis]
MEKQFKRLLGVLLLILTMFVLGKENILAKPNPNDGSPKINIDEHLTTSNKNLEIPFDSNQIYEPTLSSSHPDFVQTNTKLLNLTKKNKIFASSSIINDDGSGYTKTSDDHIIYLRGFSNWGTGMPAEISFFKAEKVDVNGNIVKSIFVGENIPQWKNSTTDGSYASGGALYQLGDIYFIPYVPISGERKYIKIDKDLNILERGVFNENKFKLDGQHRNRSSLDYLAQYWDLTYLDRISSQQNKLYAFKTDTNSAATYIERKEFDFLSYESVVPIKPNDWWLGMQSGTFKNKQNGYIGIVGYSSHVSNKKIHQVITRWDTTGKIEGQPYISSGEIVVQAAISDKDNYYFMEYVSDQVYLKKIDTLTGVVSTIKTYPKGTNINFSKSISGYSIYGYVSDFSGVFSGYENTPGVVIGLTDTNFNLTTLSTVSTNVPIVINGLIPITQTDYFLAGAFDNHETLLVDEIKQIKTDNSIGAGWSVKQKNPAPNQNDLPISKNFLYGILKVTDDYAPAIQAPGSIDINIDDVDILSQNKTAISNWLITGTKNGKLTDTSAIKVYDRFDLESSLSLYDQDWLNNRINYNYKSGLTPAIQNIDWPALGFDPTKRGPQLVTYFVTDSQGQLSSTSRWINKLDNETTSQENTALAASNFAIHVNNLNQLDEDKAKKLAKMLAWDKVTGDELDSGKNIKNIVSVDKDQLKAITDAKVAYHALENITPKEKAKLVKPYPLTFSYSNDLTRVITVFITDDTTMIDNHVVIYGFDFEESIKKVKKITSSEVIAASQATVWNFKMDWEKDHNALPLAHLTVDLNHVDPANTNLTGLNKVEAVGSYKVKFDYDNGSGITATNHLPTAHISGNIAKLHVRQVVLDGKDELVIPNQGYLTWKNIDAAALMSLSQEINTSHPLLTRDSDQTFEALKLELTFDHWLYMIQPTIPEYYQYEGYIAKTDKAISGTATEHHEADKIVPTATQNRPILNFTTNEEYWVTIYLKPISNATIRPYSWDYQLKDFGGITP